MQNVTQKEKKKMLTDLKKIIQVPNYDKFITVFKMNTDGCGTDIEQSILNALSKGNC